MLTKSVCLAAIVFLRGSFAEQVPARSNSDTCAVALSTANQPTICVQTALQLLTIDRASGHTHLYLTVENYLLKNSVVLQVSASAPSNPSGIQLKEGNRGVVKTFAIDPGIKLVDVPLLFIEAQKSNSQSGHLVYTLTATIKGIDNQSNNISVIGVPTSVDVQTIP